MDFEEVKYAEWEYAEQWKISFLYSKKMQVKKDQFIHFSSFSIPFPFRFFGHSDFNINLNIHVHVFSFGRSSINDPSYFLYVRDRRQRFFFDDWQNSDKLQSFNMAYMVRHRDKGSLSFPLFLNSTSFELDFDTILAFCFFLLLAEHLFFVPLSTSSTQTLFFI